MWTWSFQIPNQSIPTRLHHSYTVVMSMFAVCNVISCAIRSTSREMTVCVIALFYILCLQKTIERFNESLKESEERLREMVSGRR